MTVPISIILGIVEGLTEFLPISSTAHLIISSSVLHIPQTDFQKFFEVFIQSGAILAVAVLYLGFILKHRKLWKPLLFSFVPTAIIGFGLYKIIKTVFFESTPLIIISMAVIGILFLAVEYLVKNKKLKLYKSTDQINLTEAVVIGLAQAIAVVPGVSRSGIVMVTMMSMGYKREDSAVYSFILAVPTLIAAAGFDLWKMRNMITASSDYMIFIAVGFVVSFVSAYIVIRWFIGFLKKNTLVIFGFYRIILALLLFVFLGR